MLLILINELSLSILTCIKYSSVILSLQAASNGPDTTVHHRSLSLSSSSSDHYLSSSLSYLNPASKILPFLEVWQSLNEQYFKELEAALDEVFRRDLGCHLTVFDGLQQWREDPLEELLQEDVVVLQPGLVLDPVEPGAEDLPPGHAAVVHEDDAAARDGGG